MKFSATVAIMDDVLDSQGESFSENVTFPSEQVPVTFEFDGPIIGTAVILRQDNTLTAEIELFDVKNTEEIETLYAVTGGSILKKNGSRVEEWKVSSIGLTPSPADKRLTNLRLK